MHGVTCQQCRIQIGLCGNEQQDPAACILQQCLGCFTPVKQARSLLIAHRVRSVAIPIKRVSNLVGESGKTSLTLPESTTPSNFLPRTRVLVKSPTTNSPSSAAPPATGCRGRALATELLSSARLRGSELRPQHLRGEGGTSALGLTCRSPKEPATIPVPGQALDHPVPLTTASGIQTVLSGDASSIQ